MKTKKKIKKKSDKTTPTIKKKKKKIKIKLPRTQQELFVRITRLIGDEMAQGRNHPDHFASVIVSYLHGNKLVDLES